MMGKITCEPTVEHGIIIALDYSTAQEALDFAATVSPQLCKLKVGKELFTASGPVVVSRLVDAGFDVFLDLKFHDIPNTVGRAVAAAADLGVWMINVHASGGSRMLAAARQAIDRHRGNTRVVAVTVLTSMAEADMLEIGIAGNIVNQVMKLADLANQCGLDGVVCSAAEAKPVSERYGPNFWCITPGIRPYQSNLCGDDQHRVYTPAQAIAAGSSHLVIGRPVTQADDPVAALLVIREQVQDYYRVGQKPRAP